MPFGKSSLNGPVNASLDNMNKRSIDLGNTATTNGAILATCSSRRTNLYSDPKNKTVNIYAMVVPESALPVFSCTTQMKITYYLPRENMSYKTKDSI